MRLSCWKLHLLSFVRVSVLVGAIGWARSVPPRLHRVAQPYTLRLVPDSLLALLRARFADGRGDLLPCRDPDVCHGLARNLTIHQPTLRVEANDVSFDAQVSGLPFPSTPTPTTVKMGSVIQDGRLVPTDVQATVHTDGLRSYILGGLLSSLLAKTHGWDLATQLARASADPHAAGPRLPVQGCVTRDQLTFGSPRYVVDDQVVLLDVMVAPRSLGAACP
jgi:hypothetical protein